MNELQPIDFYGIPDKINEILNICEKENIIFYFYAKPLDGPASVYSCVCYGSSTHDSLAKDDENQLYQFNDVARCRGNKNKLMERLGNYD